MKTPLSFFPALLYLALIALTSSCEEDNTPQRVAWERIELPNEGVVYSIYGNLDDHLLVATTSKILRSKNGGLNWDSVQRVEEPIGEFYLLKRRHLCYLQFYRLHIARRWANVG